MELIMAQFGPDRDLLEPALNSYREHFPEATVTLYSDKEASRPGVDKTIVVDGIAPGKAASARANNFYQIVGLLASKHDIAVSFDTDTYIVSDDVVSLPVLAERFGLCLPCSSRWTVRTDIEVGARSDGKLDETCGTAFAMCYTPIAFNTSHKMAREVLGRLSNGLRLTPLRGTLQLWRAFYDAGFFPCLLPPQWCVCHQSAGIGDEIILHLGHERIRKYYGYERLWQDSRRVCTP